MSGSSGPNCPIEPPEKLHWEGWVAGARHPQEFLEIGGEGDKVIPLQGPRCTLNLLVSLGARRSVVLQNLGKLTVLFPSFPTFEITRNDFVFAVGFPPAVVTPLGGPPLALLFTDGGTFLFGKP